MKHDKAVAIGSAVLSICLQIGGLFLIAWYAHPAVAAGVFCMVWGNNISEKRFREQRLEIQNRALQKIVDHYAARPRNPSIESSEIPR